MCVIQIRNRRNDPSVANWWKALCSFAPVALFLRIYSIGIMCWDMFYLSFYTVMSIVQSGIRILRPPPLKSLHNEIAVVHYLKICYVYLI